MTRITEDLVRKRAEHNEGEIFSLKELSLHQENIEKLEHLDRWCRDLEILYLHNNLISKIENVSRLKKLEYINFTLNNITRIENLEGCESLKKLDFTVNFIGELTSIKSLVQNYNLEELYLTGNPCTDYEGYREYVIITLPQLIHLDGSKITKTERILAMQKYNYLCHEILQQQRKYLKKINLESFSATTSDADLHEEEDGKSNEEFWKEVTSFTPKSRIETYRHIEKEKQKQNYDRIDVKPKKVPRKLMTDDGRILNINEAKLDFQFIDNEDNNSFELELGTYKYMDTSLINVNIQPNYVCVMVKGRIFQLSLPKDINVDSSIAQRSEVTGHLRIIMPKVEEILKKKPNTTLRSSHVKNSFTATEKDSINKASFYDNYTHMENFSDEISISKEENLECSPCEENDLNFIDDPNVPPLI